MGWVLVGVLAAVILKVVVSELIEWRRRRLGLPAEGRPLDREQGPASCPWCGSRRGGGGRGRSEIVTCPRCKRKYEVDAHGQTRRIATEESRPGSPRVGRKGTHAPPGSDPYVVLGVERDVDARGLKKAYFKQIRRHTPEDSPDMFRQVSEAYRLLSDHEKRAEYDRSEHLPEEVQERMTEMFQTADAHPEAGYTMAESLLADHGDSETVRAAVGMVFLQSERPARALEIFEQLTRENPGSASFWRGLAICLFEAGRQEEAIEAIEKTIRLDPGDSDGYLTLAGFHMERDEAEKAVAMLDAGIQADDQVDLQDLPMLIRKIAILGTQRAFRAMHEASGALFRAMPEDDPDARTYVAHAFLSLAEEFNRATTNLPHLEKFAIDCALRAGPDSAPLRQRSVELREPARLYIEAEKAIAAADVPNWIKLAIASRLQEYSRKERAKYFRGMVGYAMETGRAAFSGQWRRFRESYPRVAEAVAEVRRAIAAAAVEAKGREW